MLKRSSVLGCVFSVAAFALMIPGLALAQAFNPQQQQQINALMAQVAALQQQINALTAGFKTHKHVVGPLNTDQVAVQRVRCTQTNLQNGNPTYGSHWVCTDDVDNALAIAVKSNTVTTAPIGP